MRSSAPAGSPRRFPITTTTTTTSTSTSGALRLRVERRGERSALVEASGHVPYAPRPASGRPGCAKVVLVQTVAGPLGGDRTEVEIEVGAEAALEVVGNAATLAFPAMTPARIDLTIRAGPGARVLWRPEPLILAAGCNLESSLTVELEAGAAALTRELVVLGRHRERPGRYRSELRCELEGRPLLHEAVEIDGVHESPALLGDAGAFGSVALLGLRTAAPAGPAQLELEGPGRVLRGLAADAAALTGTLSPVEAAWVNELLSSP